MDFLNTSHLSPSCYLRNHCFFFQNFSPNFWAQLTVVHCSSAMQRKFHTITRKPMSWHDNLEEPADARFLNLIHHAALGPRKKYTETQTESQEIGWDSEPLVNPERDDRRLNHFRVYNDITLYKAKMWSLGEDERHK
ncbi:unnamed protein product [Gulo gulo]|uniref:Protein FAM183A n=1 Tax=Gulo gulo TaxID=48420 RepID=A0A9X9PVQ5_GULGU|nr:unnamed protein product [Gulo gulo]